MDIKVKDIQLQHPARLRPAVQGYEPVRRLPLGIVPDCRQSVGALSFDQDQGVETGRYADHDRPGGAGGVLEGRFY